MGLHTGVAEGTCTDQRRWCMQQPIAHTPTDHGLQFLLSSTLRIARLHLHQPAPTTISVVTAS
jgi:hypothetical protein